MAENVSPEYCSIRPSSTTGTGPDSHRNQKIRGFSGQTPIGSLDNLKTKKIEFGLGATYDGWNIFLCY